MFYQCTSQWPTSTSSNHFQSDGEYVFFLVRWLQMVSIAAYWPAVIKTSYLPRSLATRHRLHSQYSNWMLLAFNWRKRPSFSSLFCVSSLANILPWSDIIKPAVILEPFNLCVGGVGWCEEATLSGAVSRDARWLRLGVYRTLTEFICLPKPVSLYQIYEPKEILMNQAELVSTRSVVFT